MSITTIVLYFSVIMLMRVLQSLFNKRAANALTNGSGQYFSYIAFSKLLAAGFAIVSIVISSKYGGFTLGALGIASMSGAFLAIGQFCGIKAMNTGTIVLNSVFATAGMILPIILGTIFFEEKVNVFVWLFIIILFLAIVLLTTQSKNISKGFSAKTIVYLIISMVSNGMVMFCQKLYGVTYPDGNVTLFSCLTFAVPAAALYILLLCKMPQYKKSGEKVALTKNLVIYAIILAFAVFVIQELVTLLTAEPKISSAVLFTIVNGGATVISAIVGAVVYKEKITLKSAIAIIVAVAALVCIKVFE